MLQSDEGRRSLETLFNVCTPGSLDDPNNQKSFAGDGVVYIPAQSNDPSCTTSYCNIALICQLMVDPTAGTPLDKLVTLSKAQQNGACVSANYQAELNLYSNPNLSDRLWLYQTCTEWGFYQTCEIGTHCPYTQGLHTLSYDYELCQVAFGIAASDIDYQINYANTMYGGSNIQSSRIFFVNGEIDPWHANSVLVSPNDQEPTLWVVGASHHFWTHPSKPTDSKEVVDARQAIWNQVGEWLKV
jgi:hypothetical protein